MLVTVTSSDDLVMTDELVAIIFYLIDTGSLMDCGSRSYELFMWL